MQNVKCPDCKGKGHVMDGGMALLATLSVVLTPLLVFDNDEDGLTRKRCEKCKGRGFFRLK